MLKHSNSLFTQPILEIDCISDVTELLKSWHIQWMNVIICCKVAGPTV